MRTAAPSLLPVFRSRLVGDLLGLLMADPDRWWTIRELAERTSGPYPTLTGEVRRLEAAKLIEVDMAGRTKLLRANQQNPYFRPLSKLVLMAFGPPTVVAEEFSAVEGVEGLYIFGSWAERYEGERGPPPKDVDVLVLGRPDRDAVYDAARRAEARLGREVNSTIRPTKAWQRADDSFARKVKASPLVELRARARS